MRIALPAVLLLSACQPEPASKEAPAPAAPAAPSASAAPAAPAAPAGSAAPAGPKGPVVPPPRSWELVLEDGWGELLPGTWVDETNGDAIPNGPAGGKIVPGGVRAVFVQKRAGSKTPWNVTFWAPRDGHLTAATISGGCGFYPSGKAFCRGYGILANGKAMSTMLKVETSPTTNDFPTLHLTISGILGAKLVKQ